MAWLSVAAVLVAACDKGAPPRLFTDADIATLRAHVDKRPASTGTKVAPDPGTTARIKQATDVGALYQEIESTEATLHTANAGFAQSMRWSADESYAADRIRTELMAKIVGQLDWDYGTAMYIANIVANGATAHDLLTGEVVAASRQTDIELTHATTRDDLALTLAMYDRIDDWIAKACPREASLQECHAQLTSLPASAAVTPKELIAKHASDIRAAKSDDDRHRLQAELADTLAKRTLVDYAPFIAMRAQTVTRLVALQVELEVYSVQSGQHAPCPTTKDLAEDRYTSRLAPAIMGTTPVTVEAVPRAIFVSPPTWALLPNDATPQPITISCL